MDLLVALLLGLILIVVILWLERPRKGSAKKPHFELRSERPNRVIKASKHARHDIDLRSYGKQAVPSQRLSTTKQTVSLSRQSLINSANQSHETPPRGNSLARLEPLLSGYYLEYRRESIEEGDLWYLTREELRDWSLNGFDALQRLSPESREIHKKESERRAAEISNQNKHRRKFQQDIKSLIDFFEECYGDDGEFSVTPKFKNWGTITNRLTHCIGGYFPLPEYHKKQRKKAWLEANAFLLQCYLLSKIDLVPMDPGPLMCNYAPSPADLEKIGGTLDSLYPVISSNKHLFFLHSLAYDYGYGPNAFPWPEKRIREGSLRGVPAKLYLVAIDIGALTGGKTCFVWKIGITTKSNVVGKSAESRYSGRLATYVEVLRSKGYRCGEHAFIKEQTYLRLAGEAKSRSLGSKVDLSRLCENQMRELGSTEWVLMGRPKSLAIAYFDQITQMD
jgi:hypothetical protein